LHYEINLLFASGTSLFGNHGGACHEALGRQFEC
jgi:hypothetical protein